MIKKMIAAALAALLALSLAGCGNTAAPEAPAAPNYEIERITVGTTAQIEKAVMGEYNYEMLASGVTHVPLVRQDTEGAFHPQVVSWESPDPKTWIYTVADGMKWQDGESLTADDILFTLQYEDENGSANLKDQTDSEGKVTKAKYESAAVSDDGRSITLTLASPNVRELGNMNSFRVLPRHIYEGKAELSDEELRFGYGPYVFDSFSPEAGTIVFKASETYPEAPHAGEIVYRLFANEDTMYMALQEGDIDMVWVYSGGIPAGYQDVLSAADNVDLLSVPAQNEPCVLAFNNAKGPFANEDLRHAAALVIDYDEIRSRVGSPLAQIPAAGFVPASTFGYTPTESLRTDLAEAESFMNKAGYTKNADGKFVDENGEQFGFTLTYRADRANHGSCAELIKSAIDAFGGNVTLEALDSDSYNAKTSNKFSENNITMEAALFGYTTAGMGMGNGLGTIYVDGNHAVQGGAQVYDEEFSGLLAKMAAAATPEEYTAACAEMQGYYAEHLPVVALYWDSLCYGVSSRLGGVTIDNAFGLNCAADWASVTLK
ncbi:MAG: ABC transporter substrate-binding protein [Firmicutes bacterium]|nr:ABC transporter substrate-binding protein [Bacillota bacterium]